MATDSLANIRECDAIVHVVRCFDDPNVVHVEGSVDPVRDIETINLELIFADLEALKRGWDALPSLQTMTRRPSMSWSSWKELKAALEAGKACISGTA